jgi:hypothetical protein
MHLRVSLSLLLAAAGAFAAEGWQRVLAAYGVAGDAAGIRLLVGHSPEAQREGISMSKKAIEIRQIRDVTRPELALIWEKPERVLEAKLSAEWTVFARERWQDAPVLAGKRSGEQVWIWVAADIGTKGYERFPFLPQALARLEVPQAAKADGLIAFFDASHRLRADLGYLASRWRKAGIGAIHVTSWQFDAADTQQSEWLAKLISECHAQGIAVYAWIELPHVSGKFWNEYPECREKTASGADAELDWRQLINLSNARCAALAEERVMALLRSFDWDGANLGELYFESLEGFENPSRFTPFSMEAQAYFREKLGLEPLAAMAEKGETRERFVEARAQLAADLQRAWLDKLRALQKEQPNFDLVLTHIDDRLDTRMREALGADSARLLAATEGEGVTFLIEDPATVWHLGPERYREIRRRYEGLTAEPRRLAIDLNIVERYQDVYPTKRQTGAELLQLVHEAAQNFDRVALYFEASLMPEDLPLLAGAAARVRHWEDGVVELDAPAWVRAEGVAWPLRRGQEIYLPAGRHSLIRAEGQGLAVEPRGVQLLSVDQVENGWRIIYDAAARGWLFSAEAFSAVVGEKKIAAEQNPRGEYVLELPKGSGQSLVLAEGEISGTPFPSSSPSDLLPEARN